MRGERGELRAEIHGMASSITRQMYMALLGQMTVLLGIAYFFMTNIVRCRGRAINTLARPSARRRAASLRQERPAVHV